MPVQELGGQRGEGAYFQRGLVFGRIRYIHVHDCYYTHVYDIRVISCAQLQEAVKYSFFLDSYNASDTKNYTTDTGNVSTGLIVA